MAKVDADPEALRQFAKQLRASTEQYKQVTRTLKQRLDQLDWHDDQRRQFESQLETTLKALDRFAENVHAQHAPALERKAAALDAYRGH